MNMLNITFLAQHPPTARCSWPCGGWRCCWTSCWGSWPRRTGRETLSANGEGWSLRKSLIRLVVDPIQDVGGMNIPPTESGLEFQGSGVLTAPRQHIENSIAITQHKINLFKIYHLCSSSFKWIMSCNLRPSGRTPKSLFFVRVSNPPFYTLKVDIEKIAILA